VLRRSSSILWPNDSPGRHDPDSYVGPRLVPVSPQRSRFINDSIIEGFAKQSLRTLGLAYRDFGSRSELPANWQTSTDEWDPAHPNVEQELTLYGVIGVKDPLRADVKKAVADCHHAGIMVRMVTGDNVTTARAIARECGIVTSDDDIVIEGPVFRRMTPAQVDAILPRLKVMARSSPRDKNLLVRRINGALPETPKQWEEEHAEDECTWDTDASLYYEPPTSGDTRVDEGPPVNIKIQDFLLPGYRAEWEASRKVCVVPVYVCGRGAVGPRRIQPLQGCSPPHPVGPPPTLLHLASTCCLSFRLSCIFAGPTAQGWSRAPRGGCHR
jgi:hypothetical protein